LTYRALPIALNYPTHLPVHPNAVDGSPPAILHYHRDLDDDGFLLRPCDDAAAEAADRFNRLRAERFGVAYDGLRSRSPRDRAQQRFRAALWRRQRVRSIVRDLRA